MNRIILPKISWDFRLKEFLNPFFGRGNVAETCFKCLHNGIFQWSQQHSLANMFLRMKKNLYPCRKKRDCKFLNYSKINLLCLVPVKVHILVLTPFFKLLLFFFSFCNYFSKSETIKRKGILLLNSSMTGCYPEAKFFSCLT